MNQKTSKRGRKPKSIQAKFRAKTFQFHQYWNISYTEKYKNGEEKDFKTFIRAKSFSSAKKILKLRLEEEDPFIKIKAIQGFMFHKDYKSDNGKKLGLEEWNQIRTAAFPNTSNVIFKHFMPRPDWKSNRFNATDHEHLKTIGFQKGPNNWSTLNRKGKSLAMELRQGKMWTGSEWVDWDKEDMNRIKNAIISALIKHDNIRLRAAKELGMNRNCLYKVMSRIVGVDWKKDYPPPRLAPPRVPKEQRSATQKRVMQEMMANGHKPFSNLTEDQKAKRLKNMLAAKKKKTQKRLDYYVPKMKESLDACGNSRKLAAEHLGLKIAHFRKLIHETQHIVDWAKEYPTPYNKCKKK